MIQIKKVMTVDDCERLKIHDVKDELIIFGLKIEDISYGEVTFEDDPDFERDEVFNACPKTTMIWSYPASTMVGERKGERFTVIMIPEGIDDDKD